MAVQAWVDPVEYPNFLGDIPALFIVGLVLLGLLPRGRTPAA